MEVQVEPKRTLAVTAGGKGCPAWVGGPDSNSLPGLMSPGLPGLLFTTFYLVRQGLNKSLVPWTPLVELLKEKAFCK